jgi:hypothetical protein
MVLIYKKEKKEKKRKKKKNIHILDIFLFYVFSHFSPQFKKIDLLFLSLYHFTKNKSTKKVYKLKNKNVNSRF